MLMGFDANFFINTSEEVDPEDAYDDPDWTPVTLIVDANVAGDDSESPASSRGGGGFAQFEPALRGVGVEFNILNDPTDEMFQMLEEAYQDRTALDCFVTPGESDTVGNPYLRADLKVTKFAEAQPLDGVDVIAVAVKPCPSSNPITQGVIA